MKTLAIIIALLRSFKFLTNDKYKSIIDDKLQTLTLKIDYAKPLSWISKDFVKSNYLKISFVTLMIIFISTLIIARSIDIDSNYCATSTSGQNMMFYCLLIFSITIVSAFINFAIYFGQKSSKKVWTITLVIYGIISFTTDFPPNKLITTCLDTTTLFSYSIMTQSVETKPLCTIYCWGQKANCDLEKVKKELPYIQGLNWIIFFSYYFSVYFIAMIFSLLSTGTLFIIHYLFKLTSSILYKFVDFKAGVIDALILVFLIISIFELWK